MKHVPADQTGGLRRLMQDGAWFRNAAYPYLNTITCAGHSPIGTDTFSYQHGMFLNTWFDRKTGKTTGCTDDPRGYESPTTPADIAPSLGALAGIPFRTTDGHKRSEAFAMAAPTR